MTVTAISTRITYSTNGSTSVWTFPFSIDSPGHIQLYFTNAAGTTTLVPTNMYTVAINAPIAPNPTSIGGTVTFPTSGPPIPVGNTLTIVRAVPAEQDASISNQSIIYPPVIEQEFDYLTMVDQQLTDGLTRTVQINILDPPMAPLPPVAQRANQQAIFDVNGNMVGGGAVIGTIISGPMIPVVTAPTLPDARTAMGVPSILSPVFLGDPRAPTPLLGDNDTTIATTEFVQNTLSGLGAAFPPGTRMLFQQSTAPAGWTKDVTHNDKALRVVSGTVGTGGVTAFSTVFGQTTTGGHVLTVAELASHGHGVNDPNHVHGVNDPTHFHYGYHNLVTFDVGGGLSVQGGSGVDANWNSTVQPAATGISIQGAATGVSIQVNGGNSPHSHPMDTRVLYVDIIIAQRD